MPEILDLLTANLHRVFGNRDADSRAAAAREVYAEDVVFTDPDETVVGLDALLRKAAGLIGGVPPEVGFEDEGPAYVSDGFGAQAWRLGPADAPLARGIDVVTVRDGRITELRTALVP